MQTITTERSKPTAGRLFRRFRAQFKKDSGLKNPTGAERVLIDQAALLALRVRQMRDDILAGEKPVDGDDLVRTANACIRSMSALRTITRTRDTIEPEAVAVHAPASDLDPIAILLGEKEANNG